MKEILPGIFMMPLTLSGFGPDAVNMFLIKTPEGLITIDTGWDSPEATASMEQQLKEIGASFHDIKRVLVTHAHIDHLGMIPRLKRDYGTQYYLPSGEIDLIKYRFSDVDNFLPMTDTFLQQHGMPLNELTPPDFMLPVPPRLSSIQPDVLLSEGDKIQVGSYILKVINVPGHTPGHVAYYEPDHKFIFSGDMILPTIATNAAFHVQFIPNPLKLYLESLRTLQSLDIDLVFPGHEYVFSHPGPRIADLIHDQIKKAEIVRRTFDDGSEKTAYEISRSLSRSSRTGASNWHKLTAWDKRFAVLQSAAHLKALEADGELKLDLRGGINYFQALNIKPPAGDIR
jgi:glyoxylase-like metal-dependent hydrolase (beta-lactamase superfamily II)